MIKAFRERNEGVTTRTNSPVFYGKEPLRLTPAEAFYRTLSFNPARVAGIREKQWKERRIEYDYRARRRDIYAKLKRFYLKPAKERSKIEYARIVAEIREYNERARRAGQSIPVITSSSIKSNIRRAFRPSKRERER